MLKKGKKKDARYVRWLLPVLLLAAFRIQAPAQTKATGDTVLLSDTVRWIWEATAGEGKKFSFTVDMPGYYRICWGDDSTDDYRIRHSGAGREVNHQYQQAGSYEVMAFWFAPLAADTIPYIVDTAFGIRMDMVYVEGGTFTMGCTFEQGSACNDNESPSHSVTLDGFYIGRFEVTQAQMEAVMRSNRCSSSYGLGDDYPVYYVSWEEAVAFCDSLSKRTGRKYRLPTEAEWEYAARGGQSADGTKYAGSNTVGDVAWCEGSGYYKTHPVGQKQPNGLGLYDMSGNVYEWCSDWYDSDYYSSSPATNPQGPTSGSARVYRGGSWHYNAWGCRVSNRNSSSPGYWDFDLGFRVVCEF